MKFHVAYLWIVSFLVVLPLLAQHWVFSPLFFATKTFRHNAADLVDEINTKRYLQAKSYFQSLPDSSLYKQMSGRSALNHEFVVVVITKKRFVCNRAEFDCEPHYLQQTLAALNSESKWKSVDHSVPVIICSVDPHWALHLDLDEIRQFFPIIFRYNGTVEDKPSNKQQETTDYAFCLEESSLRFKMSKYLIVAEDDAIVFKNFFHTINSIVKHRLETTIERGEPVNGERRWCWMKLYFPEFWSGFGWDANRLWELFWISIAGGMIGSILAFVARTMKRSEVSAIWWTCNGAGYLLLLVFLISRPMWLEMRRIHLSLMQVTPDSGCCSTVAVLYPMDEIPKIVDYLRSSKCHRCAYGVVLAIRDYKDTNEMLGLLVQPNLAKHIGLHSTVSSAYKDPIYFLFYDYLPF